LPGARGRGLALEASRAAVRHAYRHFGWSDVQTYMNDNNVEAKALVARLGGVQIGRQVFPDGLERDVFRIPEPA
jgi:RimJ/RimL family protein N-acetyltransferase